MIYKDFVLISLSRDWNGQEAVPVCKGILSFVADNPDDRSSMMTYSTLANIAGCKSVNGAVIQAATILTTYFHVLDIGYTYIDDSGTPFDLEEAEIKPFLEGRGFAHPDTGEDVEDPSSSIYPYFIGNRSILFQEFET